MKKSKPKYYVTTWQHDDGDEYSGTFTPQKGVRTGPYSLFGLRKALRKLRTMGYDGGREDSSVLVERVNGLACGQPADLFGEEK